MPRPFFQSRHRVPDFTVDAAAAGASLPDALAMRWPSVHRVALRQLVEAGRVRVNGMEPQLRRALREGDYVAVDAEIDALPVFRAPTPTLTVLAENEWIVVVDKPAGTPTIPDRSGKQLGVHGELAALRPEADLRIVHRLDRDTSGCLLLGKGIDAARHLDEAFRDRRVGKCYLALVHGVVAGETRTVTNWLGPDRKRPGKVVVTKPGARGARDAETTFEVVERFARYTLVRCRPRTGRGHQIRVHLAHVHHPIVGDRDYGGGDGLHLSDLKPGYKGPPGRPEAPLLARTFLHAEELTVPMPDGSTTTVRAPLPADLDLTLRKLRHFAAKES